MLSSVLGKWRALSPFHIYFFVSCLSRFSLLYTNQSGQNMIFLFVKYLHFAHAGEKQEDISSANNFDAVLYFHPTVAILSFISVLSTWQPCLKLVPSLQGNFYFKWSMSAFEFDNSIKYLFSPSFLKLERAYCVNVVSANKTLFFHPSRTSKTTYLILSRAFLLVSH